MNDKKTTCEFVIKKMSPALRQAIKVNAAQLKITMRDFIIRACEEKLQNQK